MIARFIILILLGMVGLLSGCNPNRPSSDVAPQERGAIEHAVVGLEALTNTVVGVPKGAQVAEVGQRTNSPPGLSGREVSNIAAVEAGRRRGGKAVVRSSRFEEDRWVVFLEDEDSDKVGSHCWVEISTNGVVLQYHPGR